MLHVDEQEGGCGQNINWGTQFFWLGTSGDVPSAASSYIFISGLRERRAGTALSYGRKPLSLVYLKTASPKS